MEARRFRAMGTDIELLVDAAEAGEALAAAEDEFHRLEAILSRFRPESELSRLNEAGSLEAGPELREIVALALEAREETGGRFDPTVHDAVVSAGYDRSFEQVPQNGTAVVVGSSCGGSVRVDGPPDRAGRPGSARLRGHRQGLRGCTGGSVARRSGPGARQRRRRRGRQRRHVARGRGDGRRVSHARARLGRAGHFGARSPALAQERPGAPPPDRPEDRRPVGQRSAAADRRRLRFHPGGGWAKALFLVGEEQAVEEADERGLPCVLVTADGRTRLAGGLR